jgi:RimJ/RimL family protein N-acetyltransferase
VENPKPVVLSGFGVRLEPLAPDHVDDLFQAGSYDEIWPWLRYPPPRSRDDMAQQVGDALADTDRIPFAVVVDGRAQGSTSLLDVDLSVEGVEIGWTWYTPALWATTVNQACKMLLLRHCFDELGAARVHLKTDALNTRSQSAIRKLGASYDGTLRHHKLRSDGSVRDSAYFSILATEWPQVRSGLEARLAT